MFLYLTRKPCLCALSRKRDLLRLARLHIGILRSPASTTLSAPASRHPERSEPHSAGRRIVVFASSRKL